MLTVLGGDRGSCFSFLRFIDVSPAEMSNLMLQGTLVRWVLGSRFKSLEKHRFWVVFLQAEMPFNFRRLIVLFSAFLHRWLALFLSLKAAYRLHHQRLFGFVEDVQEGSAVSPGTRERSRSESKCLSRRDLILWLNRPTGFPNTHTSPVLQVRNTRITPVVNWSSATGFGPSLQVPLTSDPHLAFWNKGLRSHSWCSPTELERQKN